MTTTTTTTTTVDTTVTGTNTTIVSYLRGTDHASAPAYLVVERPGRHDPRYRDGVVVVTVGLSTAWLLLSEMRPHGDTPSLCGERLDRSWGGADGRGDRYRERVRDYPEASLEDLRAAIVEQLALHPYAAVWGCAPTSADDDVTPYEGGGSPRPHLSLARIHR